MLKNTQIVVLTSNVWLHAGIAALLPQVSCFRMNYGDSHLPAALKPALRTLVLVDCTIFLRGEWNAFITLDTVCPNVEVVWLTLDVTGKLLPVGRKGDRALELRLPLIAFRRYLSGILYFRGNYAEICMVTLTPTEYLLLPWFIANLPMKQVSALTDKAEKTLYLHRKRIMRKTGFRQMCFLRLIHQKSRELYAIRRHRQYLCLPSSPGQQDAERCIVISPFQTV